jgi:hypothetical protein
MSDEHAGKLWPTFALRAWLAALLTQTRRVAERMEKRIGMHEQVIARLKERVGRAHQVIRSLEESLGAVDNALRRVRDAEILQEQHRPGEAAGPPREHGVEEAKPAEEGRGRSTSAGGKKTP